MTVRDEIAEANPDAIMWDGMDEAAIGIAGRCGKPILVVYDYEKCIQAVMKQGLTYEQAMEYVDFNIVGAWVGEHTPLMFFPVAPDEPARGRRKQPARQRRTRGTMKRKRKPMR